MLTSLPSKFGSKFVNIFSKLGFVFFRRFFVKNAGFSWTTGDKFVFDAGECDDDVGWW